jgi:hypothetical protein
MRHHRESSPRKSQVAATLYGYLLHKAFIINVDEHNAAPANSAPKQGFGIVGLSAVNQLWSLNKSTRRRGGWRRS